MGVINVLNAEKFRKEILENSNVVFDFSMSKDKHTIKKCLGVCDDCFFHEAGDHCSNIKVKWLLSEYKEPVKLSKLEYDILKYLLNDTGYRYIARNKYRHEGGVYNLYIFKDEPFEDSGVWCSGRDSGNEFYVFNNLFAFVKWEDSKPTSIEDVLNNCEVVNDAEE